MLAKTNRIGGRTAIESLLKKGKLFKTPFLLFRYDKEGASPRFAVSVGKKISKKAVCRNRLRRQIQESIRLNLPLLKQNCSALVIAKPSCEQAAFRDLGQNVITFFTYLSENAK